MIKLIPKLPADVVGFIVSEQLTANDYESVLIPAVESLLKQHQKVRILCHLSPAFTGFSAGAIWDDAKLGLGHLNAWEKIAIVTDKKWIKSATDIFKFAIPCPLKVYANEQYDEAELWIVS
tara:strand:+ start:9717 stop:10079 length:363 start_codon:yes stop_codon:yes gene_type:complete